MIRSLEAMGFTRIRNVFTPKGAFLPATGDTDVPHDRALTQIDEALVRRTGSGTIDLDVIGIVDAGEARRSGDGLIVHRSDGSTLTVDPPGLEPKQSTATEAVVTDRFLPDFKTQVRMRYRAQDSLPLEDNTGAVGTRRTNHMLDGQHPEFASLPIGFENGFTWVDVSGPPVSDRLFTLLSIDVTSTSWREMAALNERSDISKVDVQMRAEIARRELLLSTQDAEATATNIGAANGPILATDVRFFAEHPAVTMPRKIFRRIRHTISCTDLTVVWDGGLAGERFASDQVDLRAPEPHVAAG